MRDLLDLLLLLLSSLSLLLLFEAGSHDVPQAGIILTYVAKDDFTHPGLLVILPSDAGGITTPGSMWGWGLNPGLHTR